MDWVYAHLHLFGILADTLTFAGAVILARDAFLRLSSLRRERVDKAFRREFPKLNLTDEELREARNATMWTLAGSLLLAAGFLCQLLLRFSENRTSWRIGGRAEVPQFRYTELKRYSSMDRMQFKLPIGAKRQVTLPRAFMEMMSLEEGGELFLEVVGDHATLTPMVSVPRTALPEELRLKFEARRGQKASDITLADFLADPEGKAEVEVASVALSERSKALAKAANVQAKPVNRNTQNTETA